VLLRLIGALTAGLGRTVTLHHDTETTVDFSYEHPPVAPPQPVLRPNLTPPVIDVPPPAVPVESVPGDGALLTIPSDPPRGLSPPQPPTAPVRIDGGPGTGFPATDDFYPAARGSMTVHSSSPARGQGAIARRPRTGGR